MTDRLHRLGTVCALILMMAQPGWADEIAGEISFVRLTPSQYENSIRDIFGESIRIDGSAASLGIREHGLLAIGADVLLSLDHRWTSVRESEASDTRRL